MNGAGIALRITAILGAAAVGLGAFGAHGFRELLQSNGTTHVWEKAVFYHFVHVVVMLVITLRAPDRWRGPWVCFLVGILLFSGSLYALAATNIPWLGAITPLGGISFLVGWLWAAVCWPGGSKGVTKPQ